MNGHGGLKDEKRGAPGLDFIREIVASDLKEGRHTVIRTRFPPEPNGYLHIGHAKSICLNFGIAKEYGGALPPALRRHEPHQGGAGVRRLHHARTCAGSASTGASTCYYASDYFEQLYECAVELIEERQGLRLRPDVPTRSASTAARSPKPGTEQPVPRPVASRRTWTCSGACGPGEFPDGARMLRAKIDMALAQHQPARSRPVPHPACRRTTARATRGASTRCTTTRTASATPSRASRTPSARSSSRTTGRSTTGSSRTCPSRTTRSQIEFARLNLTYTVAEQAQAPGAGEQKATSPAGTTRACRPSRACGGAATRPRRSAHFCERIGVAKAQQRRGRGALRGLPARRPEQAGRRAGWPSCSPSRSSSRTTPRAEVEEMDAANNPEDAGAGHAEGAFLQDALHRAGGLHGGAAEEVLPALPGREVQAARAPTSSPARAS